MKHCKLLFLIFNIIFISLYLPVKAYGEDFLMQENNLKIEKDNGLGFNNQWPNSDDKTFLKRKVPTTFRCYIEVGTGMVIGNTIKKTSYRAQDLYSGILRGHRYESTITNSPALYNSLSASFGVFINNLFFIGLKTNFDIIWNQHFDITARKFFADGGFSKITNSASLQSVYYPLPFSLDMRYIAHSRSKINFYIGLAVGPTIVNSHIISSKRSSKNILGLSSYLDCGIEIERFILGVNVGALFREELGTIHENSEIWAYYSQKSPFYNYTANIKLGVMIGKKNKRNDFSN